MHGVMAGELRSITTTLAAPTDIAVRIERSRGWKGQHQSKGILLDPVQKFRNQHYVQFHLLKVIQLFCYVDYG